MNQLQEIREQIERQAGVYSAQDWLTQSQRGPCKEPFSLYDEEGKATMTACRRCDPCRAKRKSILSGRICGESQTRPWSTVETLTYSDENMLRRWGAEVFCQGVPTHDQLEKEWDRIRALLKRRDKFAKYFAVAQLGETTFRPHWHVAIFWTEKPYDFTPDYRRDGWHDPLTAPERKDGESRRAYAARKKKIQQKSLRGPFYDWWQEGHRVIDAVTPKSAGYVTEYITDTSKGTLYISKSNGLGHAHLAKVFSEKRKYPVMYPGHFPIDGIDRDTVWFALDRFGLDIAESSGYAGLWYDDGFTEKPFKVVTLADHRRNLAHRRKIHKIKRSQRIAYPPALDRAMHETRMKSRFGRSL